jgi:hypothetical protein
MVQLLVIVLTVLNFSKCDFTMLEIEIQYDFFRKTTVFSITSRPAGCDSDGMLIA